MAKYHFVCRPCAEPLKEAGRLKMGFSVSQKQTCEICGCRRFVYSCTYNRGRIKKNK